MRRAVLIFARSPRAEAAAKGLPRLEALFRSVAAAWCRAARACDAVPIVADHQRGDTFGERLANAAADAFAAGFETLLVTGIDTVPVPSLDRAFVAVESGGFDAAIAPSTDGGINAIVLSRANVSILGTFVQRDPHLADRCLVQLGRVLLLESSTDIDSTSALRVARRESLWSSFFRTQRFFSVPPLCPLCLCGDTLMPRAPPAPLHHRDTEDTEEDGECPAITCLRILRVSARFRRPTRNCSIFS